jgi:hypothetical protein
MGRTAALAAFGVGVALFGALFLPDLLAGRVFAYRDVANYHLPMSRIVAAEWRAGRVPFWNPNIACGTPLAANPNNYALYPSRLLDLALSPEAAMQAHLLGHWLAGGVAMGVLASRLGGSTWAAATSAGVFLLAGPVLSLLSFANLAPFLAWIPITALAALRVRRAPALRAAAALALCLAVQATFAEPGLLLVEALFLVAVALVDPPRAASPRAVAAGVAAAGALAAIVAAPALVPALELAARSARGGDPYADLGHSVQPLGMIEFVVPQLFGSYHTLEKSTYWGEIFHAGRGPFFLSLSLGATSVILAAAGLAARGRRGWLPAVLALVALLVSMGGYVPFVRAIVFSEAGRWLRWPVKLTLLPALVAAVASGFAVDALAGRASGRRRAAIVGAAAGAASGAVLLLLARAFAPSASSTALGPALLAPLEGLKDVPVILREVAARLTRAGAFALGTGALAVAAATAAGRRPRVAALAAGALALAPIAELAGPQRAVNRGTPVDVLRAASPILDEARALAARGFRVGFPTEHWEVRVARAPGEPDEWWPRVRLDRELGNFYHPAGEGIAMPFVNPDRLVRADAAERAVTFPRLAADEQKCMKRLLGIAATVVAGPPATAPGLAPHRTSAGWPAALAPDVDAVPVAAWLAALPEAAAARAWGGDFVRAGCANADTAWDPAASSVRARSPGRWRIAVQSSRDGFVALTESRDPGWSARVDGRSVPIVPYLHDFQAVAVPAGSHEVEWRYRPRAWNACVAASLAGLAACASAVVRRRRAAAASG